MPEYSAPVGAPIWFDLMSSDPDRAAEFYHGVFGWDVEAPREEFGGYRNFTKNGHRVAGLMPHMPEGDGPANVWCAYLYTTDAAATQKAAEAAGATTMVPPMALPACSAHMRAMVSLLPPGACETTRRVGRLG